jgi:hypothetical protein
MLCLYVILLSLQYFDRFSSLLVLYTFFVFFLYAEREWNVLLHLELSPIWLIPMESPAFPSVIETKPFTRGMSFRNLSNISYVQSQNM